MIEYKQNGAGDVFRKIGSKVESFYRNRWVSGPILNIWELPNLKPITEEEAEKEIALTRLRHVHGRIQSYLQGGGLFNPEMANHDAVRDLLIDTRDAIDNLKPKSTPVSEVLETTVAMLDILSESERGEVFTALRSEYCLACGRKGVCHCQNDV